MCLCDRYTLFITLLINVHITNWFHMKDTNNPFMLRDSHD